MIKKTFLTICVLLLFSTNSYSAGSDPKPAKVKTDYEKAVSAIKWAKKYEKKGKDQKAKKDMKKHKSYF